MKIVKDTRMEEFKKIEHLLYGANYQVWFNLYGPSDSATGLVDALKKLISKDCQISTMRSSSPRDAKSEIMEMVFHKGDIDSGPVELESKKTEIVKLMDKVFSLINIERADMVVGFRLEEVHPAYPVFWDFAYDIHVNDQRWIFIGSSSD